MLRFIITIMAHRLDSVIPQQNVLESYPNTGKSEVLQEQC
jgi:hypothetical protein